MKPRTKKTIALAAGITTVLGLSGFAGEAYLTKMEEEHRQEAIQINQEAVENFSSIQGSLERLYKLSQPILDNCENGYGLEDPCGALQRSIIPLVSPPMVKDYETASREFIENNTQAVNNFTESYTSHIDRVQEVKSAAYEGVSETTLDLWSDSKDSLNEKITAAEERLTSSKGKVDSDDTRNALQDAITAAKNHLSSTDNFPNLRIALIQRTQNHLDALDAGVAAVDADVQSRENRLAEEAKQAKAASLAQASQASRSGGTSATTGGSYSGSKSESSNSKGGSQTYYLSASMCADAWNAAGCVDGYGVTAVDFSPWGGPYWIGGHSSGSAGVIANFQVGDVVVVSGAGAGTYKVTGSTWVPKPTESETPASSLGKGFAFQTCVGNRMRVVYASRI